MGPSSICCRAVSVDSTWKPKSDASFSNRVTLFANGDDVGSCQVRACLPVHRIGAKLDSFHGHVQEIRYWTKCRTPKELKLSKNKILRSPQEPLLGYWTFEEGCGEFVEDVAMKHSRSLAIGLEWADFTTSKLDTSPTPSYRERQLCQVHIRRYKLAHQAQVRNTMVTCGQGCGAKQDY